MMRTTARTLVLLGGLTTLAACGDDAKKADAPKAAAEAAVEEEPLADEPTVDAKVLAKAETEAVTEDNAEEVLKALEDTLATELGE